MGLSSRTATSDTSPSFPSQEAIADRRMKTLVSTILENPWIPTDPHPKQAEFLTYLDEYGNEPEEGFYGGAAGGGKSEGLLIGAAQYAEVPGYAALILRKTLADLAQPGAIMDRAKDWWYGTPAKWIDDTKTWRFPSNATITFGYLEHEEDWRRYMGAEYQFIAFDELTQHNEKSYVNVGSRLRKVRSLKVPLRRRSASNPGGPGHEWVRTRFIDPGSPNRFFVPAGLQDNPSLDRDAYRRTLQGLDPVTMAQLLYGNWDIAGTGAIFDRSHFKIEQVEPLEFERLVRYWDTAMTGPTEDKKADWTVGVLAGIDTTGYVWIVDVVRFQAAPAGVQDAILATAHQDGYQVEIFIEQEPGGSGKMMIDHYITKVLTHYDAKGIRTTGKKEVRAAPYANQVSASRVKLLQGPWILSFLQEHEAFPYGSHDDQVDAASGAVVELISGETMKPASPGLASMFSRY